MQYHYLSLSVQFYCWHSISAQIFLVSYSDAFDLQFAVVIFRLRAGFDATEKMEELGWYVVIVLARVRLVCCDCVSKS